MSGHRTAAAPAGRLIGRPVGAWLALAVLVPALAGLALSVWRGGAGAVALLMAGLALGGLSGAWQWRRSRWALSFGPEGWHLDGRPVRPALAFELPGLWVLRVRDADASVRLTGRWLALGPAHAAEERRLRHAMRLVLHAARPGAGEAGAS
jgi:hypothetical protein